MGLPTAHTGQSSPHLIIQWKDQNTADSEQILHVIGMFRRASRSTVHPAIHSVFTRCTLVLMCGHCGRSLYAHVGIWFLCLCYVYFCAYCFGWYQTFLPIVEVATGTDAQTVAVHKMRFTKLKVVKRVIVLLEFFESLVSVVDDIPVLLDTVVHSIRACNHTTRRTSKVNCYIDR